MSQLLRYILPRNCAFQNLYFLSTQTMVARLGFAVCFERFLPCASLEPFCLATSVSVNTKYIVLFPTLNCIYRNFLMCLSSPYLLTAIAWLLFGAQLLQIVRAPTAEVRQLHLTIETGRQTRLLHDWCRNWRAAFRNRQVPTCCIESFHFRKWLVATQTVLRALLVPLLWISGRKSKSTSDHVSTYW